MKKQPNSNRSAEDLTVLAPDKTCGKAAPTLSQQHSTGQELQILPAWHLLLSMSLWNKCDG